MKVQVPANDIIESEFQDFVENAGPKKIGVREAFERGVTSGISQANEQLESNNPFLNDLEVHELGKELRGDVALPTKRQFLSDIDIDEEAESYSNSGRVEKICFCVGARWARDKYEAAFAGDVPNVEPTWQPVFGMKCAFWNTGEAYTRTDLWVAYSSDFLTGMKVHKGQNHNQGHYCALLESIDEIGKPPQYFIERGRATV